MLNDQGQHVARPQQPKRVKAPRPWSSATERLVLELLRKGYTYRAAGKVVNRTRRAVQTMLKARRRQSVRVEA